jgi:hypothetical protein
VLSGAPHWATSGLEASPLGTSLIPPHVTLLDPAVCGLGGGRLIGIVDYNLKDI